MLNGSMYNEIKLFFFIFKLNTLFKIQSRHLLPGNIKISQLLFFSNSVKRFAEINFIGRSSSELERLQVLQR